MKKRILSIMALAAALCACNKEQMPESETPTPDLNPQEATVFTATMEVAPETKATFDDAAKCAAWEMGDIISINGALYQAQTPGTSTIFSAHVTDEIRPTYVDGSPWQNKEDQAASMLVDAAGTSTKWCDKIGGGLYIIVSTEDECILKSIKLWNGGDTESRPGRRWKDVKVYGSSSAEGPWNEDALLKSFEGLELFSTNNGLAGELLVNSTEKYKYYKVEVLSNMGESLQQMSDMKFYVIKDEKEIRPTYVSTTTPGHYGDLNASKLVDDSGTELEWCTPKSAKVDGVWNIEVSTGHSVILKTIKLWNARNTKTNNGRTWKKVKVYGSNTANGPWGDPIGDFDNLNLAINDYGFAGDLEINAIEAYTYYKIDVFENKGGTGDDYMQMADMKFVVSEPESVETPYHAYFPSSLYYDAIATLPANITETWVDGKFNMPMYAKSNTTDLNFMNLCGVLKIIVKKNQKEKVKSIRVSSSDKATSGEFTVSNNAAVLTLPNTVANNVTVSYTNTVSTTDDGTAFYVAIPAQTYQKLKIEVSANGRDYDVMVTASGKDIVVERSKIYPVTFNPSIAGKEIAVISGEEVYVPWVQLWEGGPKFAEMNIGATLPKDYGNYYYTSDNPAYVWGNKWRCPDKTEYAALVNNTVSTWTTIDGVPGRLFTGKGKYSNNSLFFPASGYKKINVGYEKDNMCYYWTNESYRVVESSGSKNFTANLNMGGIEASVRAVVTE